MQGSRSHLHRRSHKLFKLRKDWQRRASIVDEREEGETGQVIWKGPGRTGEGDVFLVRIGKDESRQITGTEDDASEALVELRTELRAESTGRVARCGSTPS